MAKIVLAANPAIPMVLAAAELTTRAFQGESLQTLAEEVARNPDIAARLHDQALIAWLGFQPEAASDLQSQALRRRRLFRLAPHRSGKLRVLAVLLPGDLMANTPLDFMLREQDVRLDLLYHLPGHAVPADIPDHDVAVFAAGNPDPAICAELQDLFASWPRPAINPPAFVPALERDALCANLAGIKSICSPSAQLMSRDNLVSGLDFKDGEKLIRPAGTHAGHGLERLSDAADLAVYLAAEEASRFFVTQFVDYRSEDGKFRKYRIALIDGSPFLCHLAISDHWMIHYLNAGMTEDETKRAEEADAMARFDTTFAARHKTAFAALDQAIGLDFYSIDCGETPDGRLLVFEADNAAIIHMMDPPDLFPYKRPQMRKVFAAFSAMLECHSGRRWTADLIPHQLRVA
jgi:hypothetical protein